MGLGLGLVVGLGGVGELVGVGMASSASTLLDLMALRRDMSKKASLNHIFGRSNVCWKKRRFVCYELVLEELSAWDRALSVSEVILELYG